MGANSLAFAFHCSLKDSEPGCLRALFEICRPAQPDLTDLLL
jgi:hypothetical protein